ncbi:DUF1868 domain-containing protein [Corynebacterium liangguodongii]|uniref:DUF1868 domain-containing protein n=1 Tax=Corynebacterium liangguodongii TaxID=2079535 RepID=A0A2S0WCS1_9CORY|nr:DUF1868 domain-containing protein [Corynebacterium liangguodongii]AWB83472.1 DUF1868 domain-containing protein [Corynebacterium liangguodongii]PWC00439.1 DUF1868 domain-containing protein [Corynebacterium liangguodongii]
MAKLVDAPDTFEKFRADGVAKVYPGATFVAAVREGSALQRIGERIQNDVRSRGWDTDFAFTVPSSFHMTVLEGPKFNGPLPAWLEDAHDFPEAVVRMRQRLAEAHIAAPTRLEMKTTGVFNLHERLTFKLVPADEEVKADLDRFRKQAGAVLEFPVRELSEYHFHSTLGYRLTVADPDDPALLEAKALYDSWASEVTSVDLERVGFCIFNDMQSFPPLLYFDPA